MKVSVSVGNSRAVTTVSGNTQAVASVASRSKVTIGNLEDNVGNIDSGDDGIIATGETLVYNANTEKWEAVSLQAQVDASITGSESVGDAIENAIDAGLNLDGGTF